MALSSCGFPGWWLKLTLVDDPTVWFQTLQLGVTRQKICKGPVPLLRRYRGVVRERIHTVKALIFIFWNLAVAENVSDSSE